MAKLVAATGLVERYDQPLKVEREVIDDIGLPDDLAQSFKAPKANHPTEQGFEWKPVYWVYVAVCAIVLYTLFKK